MEWITIFEKALWCGIAATGFAILFNVPSRTLLLIFILGACGGFTKFFCMHFGVSVVIASLAGAMLIGFLSIQFAHVRHAPPPIFSIPAVIPMIPGIFAYRMMLGLIKLAGTVDPGNYQQLMMETVNNGMKTIFILVCLAGGVGIPMLITRKESAKDMKFKKR